MRADVVGGYLTQHVPPDSMEEQWDAAGLEKILEADLRLKIPVARWLQDDPELEREALGERSVEAARKHYQDKTASVEPQAMRHYERAIMLQSLDTHWREHLAALDHLRQGIHLRGYAQKNPQQEYKREAFELFSMMLESIKSEVTKILMTVQIKSAEELAAVEEPAAPRQVQYQHAEYAGVGDTAVDAEADGEVAVAERPQPVRVGQKVGRNDPCPCGSGRKYKHCHGKLS
jgi:preprotein translocase subunit SecA